MTKLRLILPLSICLFLTHLSAQNGGRYTFAFLKQSPSARATGLNQSQIALKSDDLALAYNNPSLLNPLMHNGLDFNQNFLLGKIKSGLASYGYHVEKVKMTFQAGVQYINYGEFKEADEYGNQIGTFKANEYAVFVGAGRQLNERFSIGANLKFIQSRLETYTSTGLAVDLSGSYINPEKFFGASVVLKNIGAQLKTYYGEARSNLPYDLQIGISKKLPRAPFRFSVVAHDLLQWQLRYDNPLENETSLLGEETNTKSAFSLAMDNVFRHLNFGGEIVLGKTENFRARFGYSHQVRREMSLQNIRSLAGFSFGAGFKVSRFRIDYGIGRQHIAGGMNHLSISTNFGSFKRS
ncbi:MAG: type IX secretion system protein PorQ [Saprospiraceae bacterium]|nr:type IX secretion system protein PorQ [Saprospiraceae bacterium]